MFKRITGFTLALLTVLISLIGAIPANADFKDGDIVTISESAGGGVYYNYDADQKYYVSAMNATMEGSDATYFAWCASYGVSVPQAGRRYILCNTDNAGTVTVDGGEWPLFYAVPSEGIYWYYDTGLGDYIDFSWALSCIKAAEHLASTTELPFTELPFSWRMAVELAIRSQLQGMFGNYGLDLNVEVADNNLFGYAISSYFTEPDCNTVAEFMERAKDIATHADDNPVFWEPYAEEIEAVEERRNFYRGDDFILFEGHLNKSNCELVGKDTYPGVEVEFDGGMLTVSIPKSKMPIGERIYWKVDLHLDPGDNYNMLYGKPENGGTDVQNIMVYSVNKRDLEKSFDGEYITTEEKAIVTVQKTNESGKALPGMGFTLYHIQNGSLGFSDERVTDNNGVASWVTLDLGYYFLVEQDNNGYEPHKPEEWNIDGATNAVYTTIGGKQGWKLLLGPGTTNATVSAVNKETLKNLNILKTDTEGNSMPGFKFTLYPILPNGSLGTGTTKETRSNGYVFFTDLKLGDYFVVENYEDTGYEPDKPENWYVVADKAEYTTIGGKQGWKITLSKNNASIEAVNKKTVKDLNIVKTDTEGNSISGFKFTVYPILPNGSLGTGITKETRSDGYVFFTALELGSYFVVENYEGTGYEPHKPEEWDIDGATNAAYTTIEGKNGWKVLLGPETTNVTVNAVNEQQTGDLTIIKTDLNGTSMPGFNFTVYPITLSGELGTGVTKPTGANGVVTFPTLKVGNYFVVEDYADTDYVPHEPENWSVVADNAEYTTIGGMQGWMVTLSKNGATINAVNKPVKTSLHIEKLNKDGSDPKGFNFTLYPVNDDGSLGEGTRKETELFGDLLFAELELGTYFLVENYEGTGYAPYKQEDWEISGAISALFTTIEGMQGWKLQLGKNNVTIYADNYKADHYITIEKVDTEGNPLAGVPFRFYAVNNGEIVEVTVVVTDTEGKATITLSNPGEFFIAEIAPVGQLPHNPDQWVVTSAKSAAFKTINGIAGWHIVLDQDNTHATLKAVNKIQTGEINISKYGEEGLTDGDVFKFEISSDNFPAFSEIITLSTNVENGVAFGCISDLPIFKADGSFITYTITEIEAPNRFVKAEPQTVTFEAEYKANRLATAYTTSVELTNPLLTRELYINKTSYNNVVEGIEFVLSFAFEDGITQSLTGTTVKTADGIGSLVFTDLPVYNKYGELIVYTLEEKRSSYDFSTAPVFTSNDTEFVLIEKLTLLFTFEQSDAHISVYNPRHPINVVVMKDSEDGAKYGFVFELSDNKGNKWSATTNADGVAIFYKDGSTTEAVELPAYDADNKAIVYTITEKPTEIYDAFVPVSFTVDDVDENNTFTLEAYNTLKRGDLVINKISDTGEKLAGAKFLLEVSKDNGISWQIATADDCSSAGLTDGVLVSDAEHNLVFSGLLMDNKTLYRVTEIKAPEGFNCQTEPVFQGRLTDKVISEGAIIVENTQTPDTGDYGFGMLPFGVMIACIGLMGILLSNKKKRTSL